MSKGKAGWPKYMFHAETGEGKVFESADQVAEGFITRDEFESRGEEAAPAEENPNKGLAKANGLTKKAMLADFKEAEVEVDASLPVDDLAALYLDTFETDPEGSEEDPGEDED